VNLGYLRFGLAAMRQEVYVWEWRVVSLLVMHKPEVAPSITKRDEKAVQMKAKRHLQSSQAKERGGTCN